jgi:hypothetical protein
MKRLRALLRLVRPALGEELFRAENVRFSDISRLLAGTRDRHVMAGTLAKLAAAPAGTDEPGVSAEAVEALRAVWAKREEGARHEDEANVREAVRRLRSAERFYRKLELDGSGFKIIGKGLGQVYRRGRRDMKQAYAGGGEEIFHDWRKMVQAHWRHMNLIARAWPKHYEARASLAKDLSGLLGDEQDLAVLAAAVAEASGSGALSSAHAEELAAAIEARRNLLRQKAEPLGALLYAERPRDFVSHARTHWRAARRTHDLGALSAEH